LEKGHDYPRGGVNRRILFKLQKMLVTSKENLIRHKGYHYCDFCGFYEEPFQPRLAFESKEITLGSSELWVPSATSPDVIYAAPNLIYHYIVVHGYRPPGVFLNAVNEFEYDPEWNAFWVRQKLIEEHRERIRSEEEHGC